MRFKNELSTQSNTQASTKNMFVESTSTVIKTKLNEEHIGNVSPANANKLLAYKNEIKQTRQLRDKEMLLKKDLTEKILVTWKELKEIRVKQNFRNTDIKLLIKKFVVLNILDMFIVTHMLYKCVPFTRKEINREKELAHIEQDLKDELEEVINEKEEELRLETSLYNQKLKAYKFQQTKKV